MRAFFIYIYSYPAIHCNPLPRLASGYKVSLLSGLGLVETALTFINYICNKD
jgi:hypothetical protein